MKVFSSVKMLAPSLISHVCTIPTSDRIAPPLKPKKIHVLPQFKQSA